MRCSISSARAARKGWPRAFWSLISLTRWSPRTTTIFIASSSTITGKALSVAPAGIPSEPTSASMVVAPGVWTTSGASSPPGSATGWASAEATSRLAA